MSETARVGAFVLESLTTGMYPNPLDAVREFVQNAMDSILQGEHELLPRGAGRVEIRVDPGERTFVLRDNGIGVPAGDVRSRLLDIGMSDKQLATSAGFRGIGRLAGIACCRKLHFRTSAAGERVVSTLEIDCDGLRRRMLPSTAHVEELSDVLVKTARITREHTSVNDHFFEVAMEGVLDTADTFLNWRELEAYLSQVAPVTLDAQHFVYAPEIEQRIHDQGIPIPTVTLLIRAPGGVEREVLKPYTTHYRTKKTRGGDYELKVKGISFYPEKVTPDTPFWLWYGKTDLLGAIDDEKVAGFRLRAKNIAIGGAKPVADLFALAGKTDRRFNAWYIGEIHVLSPGAVPNARRDDFEDHSDWPRIREALTPFIKDRVEDIRRTSEARNRPVAKIARRAEKVVTEATARLDAGFVSTQQRERLLNRLDKEHTRVREAAQAREGTADAAKLDEIARTLAQTRNAVQRKSTFVTQKLNPTLGRKQRKVIRDILKALSQALDQENYKKAEVAILTMFRIPPSDVAP